MTWRIRPTSHFITSNALFGTRVAPVKLLLVTNNWLLSSKLLFFNSYFKRILLPYNNNYNSNKSFNIWNYILIYIIYIFLLIFNLIINIPFHKYIKDLYPNRKMALKYQDWKTFLKKIQKSSYFWYPIKRFLCLLSN